MSERTAAIATVLGLSFWGLLMAYALFMWVTQ